MGLSRLELFARLGRVTTAESMFAAASTYAEEHHWRGRMQESPHGAPWFSSLHGSQFPAGDDRWCARKLVYGLMGIPEVEPFSRMLRGTMAAGQAAEDWNIGNLDLDGRLLSANLKADHQTGFEANDHWLTGAPDFIVLPPFWNRPHLIETKSKDLLVVQQMRNLERSYDAKHRRQTGAYIGMGNKISPKIWPSAVVCKETWRLAKPGIENVIDAMVCRDHGIHSDTGCLVEIKLEPLRTGSLIYMGRDRSHITAEYVFEHDEQWFQDGLAKLRQVQDSFTAGVLPAHPFKGKQWSEMPCRWCDLKRETCKPDQVAGVTKLEDSNGIEWARNVYGNYDFAAIHQTVLDRWRGRAGYSARVPENQTGRGVLAA